MHLYDLSFCQARLPRSCVYTLRFWLFGKGVKGAPLRLLQPGNPDLYLRRVKPKASILKGIIGRQATKNYLRLHSVLLKIRDRLPVILSFGSKTRHA